MPPPQVNQPLPPNHVIKAAPGLLNRIESAAGPGRDNLSLLLMVWNDKHLPKETT